MNDITIFNHLGNDIRVTTDEQGEPLFVLVDLAAALGITNATQLRSRLSDDLCQTYPIHDRVGRIQQTCVVTEPGLYEVIIRSDKPEATQFRRWVTSEVLPSIRKHGMYATPTTIEDMIANPDMAIKLLTTLKEERAARAKAEAEVEAQRPVAALGKAIETAEGDLTPSAFGKILSKTIKTMGPNKFCRWLLDNNFAFRNGQGKIIPMQDAVNRGILTLTERIDPTGKIRPQLLVTPAGQSYFAGILSCC
jgi:anti-repressor protein